jgi:hypothetical protein
VQNFTMSLKALLLIVAIFVATAPLSCQQPEPPESLQRDDPAAAINHSQRQASPAFSAEKFARVVRITPDGKELVLSERRPAKLARSAEGQIRVEDVSIDEDCSRSEKSPYACSFSEITLFNPAPQTVTHWGERSNYGHEAVILQITPSRAKEIEEDTATMPDESGSLDTEGTIVSTQNLGQKTIEGISATGFRTTTSLPARTRGNKDTITTIHEVWTSTQMNLVVKVIDGDPNKKLTIHGLDHVSFSPAPSLFQIPDDYELQDRRASTYSDQYAEPDMSQYAAWFVK